jgi:hypothetical protein
MTQLIPPPELAPSTSAELSMTQRVAAWFELMQFSEQFLLAGIRHRIGPDRDLREGVREWYRAEMEQHDRKLTHMLQQLARREGNQADG